MKKSERIALNTFLSSYPKDIHEYNMILNLIMEGSDLIEIWEPFFGHELDEICQHIDTLKSEIDNAVHDAECSQ